MPKNEFEVSARHPSTRFLVLRFAAAKAHAVDLRLRALADSDGPLLTPLGYDRYVVAQPALERLIARAPRRDIRDCLKSAAPAIQTLEFRDGEYVLKAYRGRPGLDPRDVSAVPAQPGATGEDGRSWRDAIGAVAAHQILEARRGRANGGIRFPRLAHLDTGLAAHAALGLSFPQDEWGVNFIEVGSLPIDNLKDSGGPGRGTRLLAALCGHDGTTGFYGVAPGFPALAYRVGTAAVVDAASGVLSQAVRHAVFDNGCEIVCITVGDPCEPRSSTLAEQVDAAYEVGAIVVAAAGDIVRKVVYPGRFQRVVTAAGVTASGRPWLGSARGLAVDVCAPATEISRPELFPERTVFDDYGLGDGTGYAAMQLAGAAALWLALHDGHLQPYARSWRLVEAFRHCLTASARRPDQWRDRLWGAGVLWLPDLLLETLPDPASLVMQPAAVFQKW